MRKILQKCSLIIEQKWLLDLCLLALGLSIFYLHGLGSYALLTPDEGRYAEIAREMAATGNYITPHLNGSIMLDKPILYYWLQVFAIKCFGLNEFALRLWPTMLSVLNCLMIYGVGRIIFNRQTGLWAALILATSPLYFIMAHYANMDAEVAAWISCAISAFMIARQLQNKYWLWAAYIFSGLAVLTKGLMGFVLPALIIGIWILLSCQWRMLLKLRIVSGLVIILFITMPWFLLVQHANPNFFHYFFIQQQLSRYLTTTFNDQEPFWFYIPVVIIGFFPWILFLVQAYGKQVKILKNNLSDAKTLLLIWPLVIFIFFSLPLSKTIGYIDSIFAPLALLVANYISQQNIERNRSLYMSIVFYIILTALSIMVLFWLIYSSQLMLIAAKPVVIFTIAILLVSTTALIFFLRIKATQIAFIIILLTNIIILSLSPKLMELNNKHSVKPLAQIINQYIKPDDKLITYYRYYYDLPVYLQRRILVVSTWDTPAVIYGDNWEHELANGKRTEQSKKWLLDDSVFWQMWHSDKRVFVLLDSVFADEFKKIAGQNFYSLAHYKNIYLVTNLPWRNTQTLLNKNVMTASKMITNVNDTK